MIYSWATKNSGAEGHLDRDNFGEGLWADQSWRDVAKPWQLREPDTWSGQHASEDFSRDPAHVQHSE